MDNNEICGLKLLGLEEGFRQLKKLKKCNFWRLLWNCSFLSTTINLNLEWTLPLEVHGNDSFSNLRFHFDLHMCHSLSIKKARLYRKVCNKTCCSPSPITFFHRFIKQSVSGPFIHTKTKKLSEKIMVVDEVKSHGEIPVLYTVCA